MGRTKVSRTKSSARFIIAACAFAGVGVLTSGVASAAMLTQGICRKLQAHEAANNVAYQPGVTVRGGRVRQANVRKRNDPSPLPASVDVSVLLQDRYAVPVNRKLYKGEIPISRFFVRSDGVVSYAGQPLAADDQQQVSAICRRAWGIGG